MMTRTTARIFPRLIQSISLVMAAACFAAGNSIPAVRMPSELPISGYGVTNALGGLRFDQPVAMASVPGETNRLFIAEKTGRIIVITNLAAPTSHEFLDASAELSANGEGGLLGLAFHPGFKTNGFFFIYRTIGAKLNVHNAFYDEVARYRVDPANPHHALAESKTRILLQLDHDPGQHNGGDLQFGPDGYLYISIGNDGPSPAEGPPPPQAIDRHFFGSILRIDVDHRPGNLAPNPYPSGVANYSIPTDNPFIGRTSHNGKAVNPAAVRTELYAIGLRNPWRITFDGSTLYAADVGNGAFEEVNLVRRGGNYGWPFLEGKVGRDIPFPARFTSIPPVHTYSRGSRMTNGYCIVGGPVYRGRKIPELSGTYVFGDFVAGTIWGIRHNGTTVNELTSLTSVPELTTFGVDPSNGDVLAASFSGTIWRLIYVEPESTSLPVTLAETSAFEELEALRPAGSLVPYEVAVPFWSDGAFKQRWFVMPEAEAKMGFSARTNWTFPTGMVWVKHFELELTEGVPSSRRRLETRFLVKTEGGVYGVTYRWGNSRSNAFLVPEGGMEERFVINNGPARRTQTWTYPSRSSCLKCHNAGAGYILGFNTPQMNCDVPHGGGRTNQLQFLSSRGLLDTAITMPHTLPVLADPQDGSLPLEHRARSYLQANCAQCHYPGGPTAARWNARITTPVADASIIDVASLTAPWNKIIKSGSPDESTLLHRISQSFARMPPVATSELDKNAISVITEYARTLPTPPWTRQDVGVLGREGSSSIENGFYRVSGSGTNIGGTADAFHYLSHPLPEHGQVIARLISNDSPAAAGVMIRGGNSSDAPFAMVARKGGRISFRRRFSGAADAVVTDGEFHPAKWLRLVRRGTMIEAYTSVDRNAWTGHGTTSCEMNPEVLAGLAVCSGTNWQATTAIFDKVSVLGLKLEAPIHDTSSVLPAAVEMRATVSTNGIGVARVEFYDSDRLLGIVDRPPYRMLWTGGVEGRHSITARAVDDQGTSVSSAAAEVNLSIPPTRGGRSDQDRLTQGNWRSEFGKLAHVMAGVSTNLPSSITFHTSASKVKIWATHPKGTRALVGPTGPRRTATAWTSTTNLTLDLGFLDGSLHRVALYFVDWEKLNRTQLVEILDLETGTLLASNVVSKFNRGVFLTWQVRGRIQIRVTRISGPNAVLSGVFVDPAANTLPALQILAPTSQQKIDLNTEVLIQASASDSDGIAKMEFFADGLLLGELAEGPFRIRWRPSSLGPHVLAVCATDGLGQQRESSIAVTAVLPSASAQLVHVDTTTQGRWIGTYGTDGFSIAGYDTNYPPYVSVHFTDSPERVYFTEHTARELSRLDREESILSVWRVGGPIDLQFLDGANHLLAAYFVDVERARDQRVLILNGETGATLSQVDLSGFGDGRYLVWNVRGHLKIRLSSPQGAETYISGFFFDRPAAVPSSGDGVARLVRSIDNGLVLEVRRHQTNANAALEIEASPDLLSWHPVEEELEQVQALEEGDTQIVILRLSETARDAQRGFFRVRFRPHP